VLWAWAMSVAWKGVNPEAKRGKGGIPILPRGKEKRRRAGLLIRFWTVVQGRDQASEGKSVPSPRGGGVQFRGQGSNTVASQRGARSANRNGKKGETAVVAETVLLPALLKKAPSAKGVQARPRGVGMTENPPCPY